MCLRLLGGIVVSGKGGLRIGKETRRKKRCVIFRKRRIRLRHEDLQPLSSQMNGLLRRQIVDEDAALRWLRCASQGKRGRDDKRRDNEQRASYGFSGHRSPSFAVSVDTRREGSDGYTADR